MTAWRTVLFFGVLTLTIRLMGKRQVGQMEPAEFAVAMLIADLAAIPVENPGTPLAQGLIPIALVYAGERLLSGLSYRSIRWRRILCGKPVILVENGRPVLPNLRRTRVNLDELSGQIRQQGVLELSQVQFAILETNGAVTVFPFPADRSATAREAGIPTQPQELPYTVLSGGRLVEENLRAVGKSRQWLQQVLARHQCRQAQVVLLTVTKSGKVTLLLDS